MADTVPPGKRIDRRALERIIRRAAELQTGEHEIGEGLTEAEVLQLGADVGIPPTHLRKALLEERTRSVMSSERGLAAWLTGPRYVHAERTLDDEEEATETALNRWMLDGELLAVKRRYPDQTSWEPRRGTMASLKRSLRAGGRSYELARAREIAGQVVDLGGGRVHVRLIADLRNTRRDHLAGAAGFAITGSGLTAVALTLGVAASVAVLPLPLALLVGFGIARARRSEIERMQVALEQVLDRLEHKEIDLPNQVQGQQNPFLRIAEEVRKQLGA
jgi:hypothetical protein